MRGSMTGRLRGVWAMACAGLWMAGIVACASSTAINPAGEGAAMSIADVRVAKDGATTVVTLLGLEEPVFTAFAAADPGSRDRRSRLGGAGTRCTTPIAVYDGLVEEVSMAPFSTGHGRADDPRRDLAHRACALQGGGRRRGPGDPHRRRCRRWRATASPEAEEIAATPASDDPWAVAPMARCRRCEPARGRRRARRCPRPTPPDAGGGERARDQAARDRRREDRRRRDAPPARERQPAERGDLRAHGPEPAGDRPARPPERRGQEHDRRRLAAGRAGARGPSRQARARGGGRRRRRERLRRPPRGADGEWSGGGARPGRRPRPGGFGRDAPRRLRRCWRRMRRASRRRPQPSAGRAAERPRRRPPMRAGPSPSTVSSSTPRTSATASSCSASARSTTSSTSPIPRRSCSRSRRRRSTRKRPCASRPRPADRSRS